MERDNTITMPHMVLKDYLDKRKITQTALLGMCQKKGYHITQGSLSKVISGKKKMSLDECVAICDVLNISTDMLLFSQRRVQEENDSFFLLENQDIQGLQCILGEYFIVFLSTAEEEDSKLIEGRLHLYVERQKVCAQVNIFLEGTDMKEYMGFVWRGKNWPVAYIITKRIKTGEMAIIALRLRDFSSKKMKCRMSLCLTTCAGEKKEPISYYVALVRKNPIMSKKWVHIREELVQWLHQTKACRLSIDDDIELFRQMDVWEGNL